VFYKILNDKIVETIPQTSVTVRPNDRPGMTREVRLLFRNTHRLYRIAKEQRMNLILRNTATLVGLLKNAGVKPDPLIMRVFMPRIV